MGLSFPGCLLALLDHLTRLQQECLRDRDAQRLRGLQVDDQLERRRLRDGEISAAWAPSMRPSAVKPQFRVIRHERPRSDMNLAACLDIRPGRKASDDLLSVPTTWVGHPILYSLCGESRQTREEARPFSVAALASGPVPLSSGSHQVAPSLRRSSASDRESHYAVFSRAPSGTTPNSRKRHSAINNFRARATIPTLRARGPPRPKRA